MDAVKEIWQQLIVYEHRILGISGWQQNMQDQGSIGYWSINFA